MPEGHLDERPEGARVDRERPPGRVLGGFLLRQRGDAVTLEQRIDPLPGLVRQHRPQPGGVESALLRAGILARHEEIYPEGALARALTDPREVDVELLGRVCHRAEHAQAAGPAHRGDDVSTVGKGEDREVDPQHLGDSGAQFFRPPQLADSGFGRCSAGPPAGPTRSPARASRAGRPAAIRPWREAAASPPRGKRRRAAARRRAAGRHDACPGPAAPVRRRSP